jgi:hypothetical protein
MTTLTDFRTQVLQILGDPSGSRFDTDTLDEALRWALGEYGRAAPQVMTAEFTVTTAGREQDLSSLSGIGSILELYYPYTSGDESPTQQAGFYQYQRGGKLYATISGHNVPAVGDVMRITYTTGQTIENLDSATETSVLSTHEYVLASGAAGKAATMRAAALIEMYGSRQEEYTRLEAWGEKMLIEYADRLLMIKAENIFPGFRPQGWQLDDWDCRYKD